MSESKSLIDVNDPKDYWGELMNDYDFDEILKDCNTEGNDRAYEFVELKLSNRLSTGIIDFCSDKEYTLYTFFLSSLYTLLYKYTGKEDIVVAIPMMGEEKKGFLPQRKKINWSQKVRDLLIQTGNNLMKGYRYQDYKWRNIIYGDEESEEVKTVEEIVLAFNRLNDITAVCEEIRGKNNKLSVVVIQNNRSISLRFTSSRGLFEEGRNRLKSLATCYMKVMQSMIANSEQTIREIDIISDRERVYICRKYNKTEDKYHHKCLLHDMFQKQVEITPDQIAVINYDETITYAELNHRSDQICEYLNRSGIETGSAIGVTNERCIQTICNILGILKAGAVYVPIDYSYPEERKTYMMKQSKAKILLSPDFYKEHGIKAFQGNRKEIETDPSDSAYVIFTSGSTGQPKGVEISHQSACNTIIDLNRKLKAGEKDRFLGLSSLCFDLSVYDIFGALSCGGTLVQIRDQRDVNDVFQVMDNYQVTIWNSVPAIMEMVVNNAREKYRNNYLRAVLLSGDWIPTELPKKIWGYFGNALVMSLGGATEASIWSIYYQIEKVDKYWKSIPYGMPLEKQCIYIMNNDLQLMPVGASGEIYIGGEGLAKGYINDPEKTNRAFVTHPEFGRIYRTGDYGKLSLGGYVVFQGRKDEQIKIRGYRVELGEIEKRLTDVKDVKRAVVVPVQSNQGNMHLCAYIVADRKIITEEIKNRISDYLPPYMIPTYFIQLDELPLTGNGKVNIKALKHSEELIELRETALEEYLEPKSHEEKMLAEIWQDILGVDKVGVNDNFFMLGGDSLKAIQLVSLLQNKNLKITIHQLFVNPTIALISKVLSEETVNISQETVTGDVSLSPIQIFFFDLNLDRKNLFNQYMVLEMEESLKIKELEKAFERLVQHHDMLRTRFHIDGNKARQYILDSDAPCFQIREFDLRHDPYGNESYQDIISKINESVNIENGNQIQLGIIRRNKKDLLCICIHHLLVDGMSWRIILEDFTKCYQSVFYGKQYELPRKTHSYQHWVKEVNQYANSENIKQQEAYWYKVISGETLRISTKSFNKEEGRKSRRVKTTIGREETKKLIREIHRAYKTEINDILLAALEMALHYWEKIGFVNVNMEGHGREEIVEGLNVTRTVGWFTSMYPVILDSSLNNVKSHIKYVKKMLRKIPNKGIDYNILKYISGNNYFKKMEEQQNCEISFNYLGEVDGSSEKVSLYDNGLFNAEENTWPFNIDINALIADGRFQYEITYHTDSFSEDEIQELADYYKLSIKTIIDHCVEVQNELCEEVEGEHFYQLIQSDTNHRYEKFPLTDVQMAYLLGKSEEYELGGVSTHMYLELETGLSMERFAKSLNKVIRRHLMMQAQISPNGYQYFLKDVPYYQMVIEDLRECSSAEINEKIVKERERMSHYMFQSDQWPLFEFKAFQLGDDKSYLFIGYDLLMADATSIMQIIMRELLEFYNNPKIKLPEINVTFRDYVIAYQAFKKESEYYKKDKEYWLSKLDDFPIGLSVPYKQDPSTVKKPHFERLTLTMKREKWEKLKRTAQRKGITPSVLLGTAYAHVLKFWSNQDRFAINLTVFNRYPFHNEVYNLVGDFTSIILLEADLRKGKEFWEDAKSVQASLLDALDHRHYDGVEFIRELSKRNNLGTSVVMPFVFTSMVFNNISNDLSQLGEIKWSVSQTSQVYIDNQVMEDRGNLVISWDYVEQIFDTQVIQTMFDQYIMLLENLLDKKEKYYLELPPGQRKFLTYYNNTASEIKPVLLHEMFMRKAKESPEQIALIYKDEVMTYGELNKRSNQLARCLIEKGVMRNISVGVLAHRRPSSIVNIMAILKAGGAYVPIEPAFPDERKEYIMKNSNSDILLMRNAYEELGACEHSDEPLPLTNKLNDIAYVIYTSGSTGNPKGVVIHHAAVSNTIQDINTRYNINANDRFIGLSSMCFDLSVYDIFGSLTAGALLVMVEDQRDAFEINDIIKKHKITVWNSVPAIMDMTLKAQNCYAGESEIYYWSAAKHWSIDNNTLKIGDKTYEEYDDFKDIIAEIYFTVQNGVTIQELTKKFPEMDERRLLIFMNSMIQDKVFINSLMDPSELYASQNGLVQHEYGNELYIDQEVYKKFKLDQLSRGLLNVSKKGYVQLKYSEYPAEISNRRTYRIFDEEKKVDIDRFSMLLSAFRQIKEGDEIRYLYACAGGLYPIDLYVHVKPKRIEGLAGGLYFYNPVHNTLEMIEENPGIDDNAHYYTNKSIFRSSAFSVYFIYNAEVSMPKYNGMGYYYAGIDTGIMVGFMTQISEQIGIGLCSIGDMQFERIKPIFKLDKNHVLIHTVECGLKDDLVIKDKKDIVIKELHVSGTRQNLSCGDENETADSLRLVILSGDWIGLKLPDEIKKHYSNTELVSMGGATEASIWSIYYPIDCVEDEWNSIPYGFPLTNQQIYILDKDLQQCPVGVKGEIYIGGTGVASGYQNDDERTKKAFINHRKFGRVYKTGDYGRMDPKGYVVFLGRMDYQVKIRGYRIELEEIESCLLEEENVNRVVVMDFTDAAGNQALCAYYTGADIENETLLKRAQKKLPAYMIPSYFVHLDEIPLTKNGKVNRKGLPKPEKKMLSPNNFKIPENKVQEQLVKIWKEILDLDEIGIDDSFFGLGGYSIQATLLLAKVKNQYHVDIPLKEIFSSPTIRKISEIIMRKQTRSKEQSTHAPFKMKEIKSKGWKENREGIVLLREGSDCDRHIFLIHDVTGEVEGYADFCKYVNATYHCWGIRADYLNSNAPKQINLEDITDEYIWRIKTKQPVGPYIIGGWSMGGVISFEIVRKLEQMNEEVEFLCVFDGITPDVSSAEYKEVFNLENERNLFEKKMVSLKDAFIIDEIKNVEELWNRIVILCNQEDEMKEQVKSMVKEQLGSLYYGIPGIINADIELIVHYTNVIRSISNLYYGYYPVTKINSRLMFFHADNSEYSKNIEKWDELTVLPVNYMELKGTHFSIFKTDDVKLLAAKFNGLLKNTHMIGGNTDNGNIGN